MTDTRTGARDRAECLGRKRPRQMAVTSNRSAARSNRGLSGQSLSRRESVCNSRQARYHYAKRYTTSPPIASSLGCACVSAAEADPLLPCPCCGFEAARKTPHARTRLPTCLSTWINSPWAVRCGRRFRANWVCEYLGTLGPFIVLLAFVLLPLDIRMPMQGMVPSLSYT